MKTGIRLLIISIILTAVPFVAYFGFLALASYAWRG